MTERVPIDFMASQFIVLDGFDRVRRRHLIRVIRGCGGSIGSWASRKKAPMRILIGDSYFAPTHGPGTSIEVDGVDLGVMPVRAWKLRDLSEAKVLREDEIIASTGLGLGAHERMSMLRGALQGEPSREAWAHALAVLEAWPHDQGPDDAIRYAVDLTRGWPADVCVSSRRWIKRSRQVSAPRMRLAKHVVVRPNENLGDVFRALDGAPRVEALTFYGPSDDDYRLTLLREVLAHPAARRVHTVTLRFRLWWPMRETFQKVILEADLPALERIVVGPRLNRGVFFDREQTLALLARDPEVAYLDMEGEPIWRDVLGA